MGKLRLGEDDWPRPKTAQDDCLSVCCALSVLGSLASAALLLSLLTWVHLSLPQQEGQRLSFLGGRREGDRERQGANNWVISGEFRKTHGLSCTYGRKLSP